MDRRTSGKIAGKLKDITPGGVSSPVRAFDPFPVVVEKGEGCAITDVDGNDYVDLCTAYGPLIGGHCCPAVVSAVKEQLGKGTVYGAPSVPEERLIARINEKVPCADMVRLANSGTEATMHAIRVARGFTGNNGIVKMNGGFHGAHDAVLVAAGSGSAGSVPGSEGVPVESVKNTYVAEYNDPAGLDDLLSKNEDMAAVIMEPVLGNVGVVTPQDGYLQQVRKITEEHDVLLIFDEVICGFRLGENGAQGRFGVTPDMTTLGKIIGGGFPAGAFVGRKEIMEKCAPAGPVYVAGTFSGNPVSASAGLALIDYMAEGNRYDNLEKRTAELVFGLRDLLEDSGVAGCIQTIASMFSLYFGLDSVSNGSEASKTDRKMFTKMFSYMLDHGIYLPPGPLEVEFMSDATDNDAVRKITETFGGFLRSVKG